MDRRGEVVTSVPALWGAILAAALVAAACSSAPEALESAAIDGPEAADIRALRWAGADVDKVAFLTSKPATCERPAADDVEARRRRLGRIAFESPALLGGAAGRMGLSCASCHVNGRGNPGFFIEGVSDKPGTADVTSSVMSKVRGDGNFNPVPIPDLAAKDGKQIRDRKSAEFRTKVHGLVAEEFDGQEPPPEVFDALLAYLDALEFPCAPEGGVYGYLDDYGAAFLSAAQIEASPRPETAQFYVRAARERLERLHERYAGPDLAEARREIVAMSRRLQDASETLRRGAQPPAADMAAWARLAAVLQRGESKSLYDPGTLRAALSGAARRDR